jgi:protein-S-isoprenylcysteine O-methyltransferase Ste14
MNEDRPSRFPWPPIVFVVAIMVSVVLNVFWPLPWIGRPLSDFLFAIGLVLAVVSIVLVIAAIQTLRRANTTFEAHKRADHLVTRGPFSFSRNPIYLSNTAMMIGLGFIFSIGWFVVVGLVAAWITQKLAIEPEEAHLEARFGKAFRDYKKQVRRWF